MEERVMISAIGEDSHAFLEEGTAKPLLLGGVLIPKAPGLAGNSDADVLLHALCNAISGLTAQPVLGVRADRLCAQGITDSAAYVKLALQDLTEDARAFRLLHVSFSVEAKYPRLAPFQPAICRHVAELLSLSAQAVTLTATSGEGLTAFGRGAGMRAMCIVSASCFLERR